MFKKLFLLALLLNLVPLVYEQQALFAPVASAQFGEEDDIIDYLDDIFDDDDFEEGIVDECMSGSSVVIIYSYSNTYVSGNAIYQQNCTQRIYPCSMQSDAADCSSTLIGYLPDPTDCAGVPNGSAYMADCGCIGGTTGIYECPGENVDCAGVPNGSAYMADCGCIGGTTGVYSCPPATDCAGVAGGSAYVADCGCIGGTTGITQCGCPNEVFPAASATVAVGAPFSIPVGNDWGITFPENVDIEIMACLDGGVWKAILTGLNGNYSQQIHLVAGVSEVTGIGGNTTTSNFCKQVGDLKALGNVAGVSWYMLSAVKAHEDVHASRFEPSLEAVAGTIEGSVEALSVPGTGQSEAAAIAAIKALPAWATAKSNAYSTWLAQCSAAISGDHAPGGPTDTAEHGVVDPVASGICTYAINHGWPACVNCP